MTRSAIPSIGSDVVELGVVYVAKLADVVYVLHCFQKMTQQSANRDIELAKWRFKELLKEITP